MKTKRTLSLLLCLIMAFCFTVTGQVVQVSAQTKTYTQVTALSDITDGQYLLIAKFGTADTIPNDVMVKPEESPVTVSPINGKTRKGLVITEFTGGDVTSITEDYTDYEWTFTKSGENWLLGDGTEFAYITEDDTYKRPLTMEATGSLFSILEHSVKGFAFQNTDGRVFNYNSDIGAISGYDSNPVGFYIYKLESGSVVEPEEPDEPDVPGEQSKTYTQVTALSDIVDGQYLLIAKFGTADTIPNDVMVKPEESPVTVSPINGKTRKGLIITEFTGGDVTSITEDYTDYEWTFTKSGDGWHLGDGTEYAYITSDPTYKYPLTMETTGSLFTIFNHGTKGFAFKTSEDLVFNYNGDISAISGYNYNEVGFYIYKLESGSVVEPEEPDVPDVPDDDGKTTIIACSDFQPENGNTAGKVVLQGLVNSLKNAGITTADGFLCCGDYDYEYSETKQGIDTVKETVSSIVDQNMVFIQGNHDSAIGTNGMNLSGNNDPESGEYGVFAINEDDYMWYNNDEATIKRTAQSLIEYLNEKIAAEYDKPIFVMSHLPLHYTMRTKNDGDGQHANYIFDVLNAAGAKGLNIIFMFGHDHSNGWDDYLGGAAIYLKKGDDILIAQNSRTTYENETLNFTYMNAGYIGYYRNVNQGADTTLTMTVFDITDEQVSVARYDSAGLHNLKSAGVTNDYRDESGYDPNTTVYTSPQTITLTAVTNTDPIPDLIEKPKPPTPPAQPEVSTDDQYIRITSAEFLKDGGQYLLVYNGALNADGISMDDQIMLPEVKSVERIGFNIESTTAFGGDVVKGDYASKLWTFTKSGSNWLFGDGEKYAAITNTTTHKITATLEDNGSVFTIGGSADAFTFTSGSYVLNYNSRGLINGYESAPACFYIYEYVPGVVPTTETSVTPTASGISGEVVLSNVPVGSTLIITAYLGGQLVYAPQIITTTEDTTEDFTFASGIDTVKVFVWEDTASMAPVTVAEAVPVR